MPQIGPLEVLLVGVIALIVFGPQRLPEIARSVGRAVAEFRRQASDLREEFSSGLEADDVEDEMPLPGDVDAAGATEASTTAIPAEDRASEDRPGDDRPDVVPPPA
ncbi:MAG TPA: Sec-independent protein translocase protein TatB [Actinomycetota bacterium]|nr:Sec-independent protein translocase protein TatB [Actinomycetota bacterium]